VPPLLATAEPPVAAPPEPSFDEPPLAEEPPVEGEPSSPESLLEEQPATASKKHAETKKDCTARDPKGP
jgi:hypothetical protein